MEPVVPSPRSQGKGKGKGQEPRQRKTTGRSPGTTLALVIYSALVVIGPLAFGAVDRLTQVALLGLFSLGLSVRPAARVVLSQWANRLALTLLALILAKEFAPAAWFGAVRWRTLLVEKYQLSLPWTHHPEPGRAIDALLVWVVAGLWFLWVRRLAAERENRPWLAWTLLISAGAVAAVSMITRGLNPEAIYGWRYTPGWAGFGPFPNRNHTGDLLAMGMVLGCGCVAWAAARQAWLAAIAGAGLAGYILVALLTSQSRGGLVAGGGGFLLFLGLFFLRVRSRRAVLGGVVGLALGVVLAISWGSRVFGRFDSASGDLSNHARLTIWKDAVTMWQDAPLFGHGLETFPQIIGVYQTLRLENGVILHPESSLLLWLVELGLLPLLVGTAAFCWFLRKQLQAAFQQRRSFFLQIGGLCAFVVLLLHSAIDVPAHRWGTMGFALAALALACPGQARVPGVSRRMSYVPLAVAAFWSLPFICDWPGWAPLTMTRQLTLEQSTGMVPLEQLRQELVSFPLEAQLHEAAGLRLVKVLGKSAPSVWQRHFGIATELIPGAWSIAAEQARAVFRLSPGLAFGYWQEAIDRCDVHRGEVFLTAVSETAASPLAESAWSRYVEAHPSLLLVYAQVVPVEQARYYFSLWWKERAFRPDLDPNELDAYYRNAAAWSDPAQFGEWMRRRETWKSRDFRRWAALLHQWGDESAAFALLAEFTAEPEFPKIEPAPRDQLEARWRLNPKNVVNAQQLAISRARDGEKVQSDEIITTVAQQEGVPVWFLQKAGFILARQGRHGEGVALLLRAK